MKKQKIGTKVFKIISFILIILLSGQLIFQTLFLEKLYIYSKKSSISKEMSELSRQIIDLPIEKISRELRRFSQMSGVTTGIFNVEGIPLYGLDSQNGLIEVETNEGKIYTINISQFLENENFINRLKQGEGVRFKTLSIVNEKDIIYPTTIQIGGESFEAISAISTTIEAKSIDVKSIEGKQERNQVIPAEPITTSYIRLDEERPMIQEVEISGKIKEVYIPGEEVFGTGYRENKMIEEVNVFLYEAALSGKTLAVGVPILYEKIDSYVGIRNIISVVPIILDEQVNFLVSMTFLEQVEEAINIMNQYTFIIYFLALLVAVGLAYWYAKKLTKPLIMLKDVTTAITQLNFSKQCEVDSEDEIGELASNINEMSTKLKETLYKLQEDMAFKEKLSEQRKQFIVDVSHELKTPLTVLKATCEGYRDQIYTCHNEEPIHNMLIQIDRMSELVQELLMIVRIEQEENLKKEIFDLSSSFLKVYSQYKTVTNEKGIKAKLDLEESIVVGDRKKIEMVLGNLYSNAVFYTPLQGHINVEIKKLDNKWCFSMENYGVTIEKEELEKVWEPFYRVEKSRNKYLGGSGLGLYIVKKVLDSHGVQYGIEGSKNSVKVWFILENIATENFNSDTFI